VWRQASLPDVEGGIFAARKGVGRDGLQQNFNALRYA